MNIVLTDQDFDKTIQAAGKPVLVDFWASWCQPCFILGPLLEKVAEENKEKFIFAKVNIDEAPNIAQKYLIGQVPTVVIFNWGKPVAGFVGVRPEAAIREWLESGREAISKIREKIDTIISNYDGYARKNGFRLNPDKEAVKRVVVGLLENEKKHGAKYCPCRRVSGNREEDIKNICPCRYHKEEIEKEGSCLCGLFVK